MSVKKMTGCVDTATNGIANGGREYHERPWIEENIESGFA